MATANVQNDLPRFLSGFRYGGFLGLLYRFQNLRNLRKKFARLESPAKETFQNYRLHSAESLKPEREFWRDIFLVLDAEAKEPLSN